jgi:environmental stress-induced protein Ves
VITVIDGAGMTLTRSDGLAVTLRPGAPFAFHGEDAYTGALVGGAAARDFNVLVARDVYAAAVAPAEPGRVRATWLLALAAGRVGGVAVERWDLAELDGDVMSEVAGLAVTITGRESGRAEGEPPRGAGPSR